MYSHHICGVSLSEPSASVLIVDVFQGERGLDGISLPGPPGAPGPPGPVINLHEVSPLMSHIFIMSHWIDFKDMDANSNAMNVSPLSVDAE